MTETQRLREVLAITAMPVMLILVEVIGVILSVPMIKSGFAVFEDPASFENPIWFIGMLLGFTIILLILIKFHQKQILKILIWVSLFLSFIYVFSGLLALAGFGITVITILALLLGAGATILLILYPEWYIVDILGVLLSSGIASVFGISLEPAPVILLLILLAAYDAISVYRTKHMLTLAQGVIDNRMPIMVVVPKREGYSFIRDGIGGSITQDIEDSEKISPPIQSQEEKRERSAYLMGLGDLIMPSILVVSAAVFLPGSGVWGFSIPALTAMAGSVAGMGVLMSFVSSGKPHAGLPPLNGGAIIGFLVGYLIISL